MYGQSYLCMFKPTSCKLGHAMVSASLQNFMLYGGTIFTSLSQPQKREAGILGHCDLIGLK